MKVLDLSGVTSCCDVIEVQVREGSHILDVLCDAKHLSENGHLRVRFSFNGVTLVVEPLVKLSELHRRYCELIGAK